MLLLPAAEPFDLVGLAGGCSDLAGELDLTGEAALTGEEALLVDAGLVGDAGLMGEEALAGGDLAGESFLVHLRAAGRSSLSVGRSTSKATRGPDDFLCSLLAWEPGLGGEAAGGGGSTELVETPVVALATLMLGLLATVDSGFSLTTKRTR